MIWNIFKKKLHKKVLVLVGVPYEYETFNQLYKKGNSDFLSSLAEQFHSFDIDDLWNKYKDTARSVANAIDNVKARGADVLRFDNCEILNQIINYDNVIVIAHHSDARDEFDLLGNMIREKDFLNQLPKGFKGIVDMTSCFSSAVQLRMKMQMPESHIIAVDAKSSLEFRMFMMTQIIDILCNHKDFSYIDAIKYYIELRKSIDSSSTESIDSKDVVYLGKETVSSVYAPKSVRKEDGIIVQVVIHKDNESDNVSLKVQSIDETTSLQNETTLSLKVKKGDSVDIQLVPLKKDSCFTIDEELQTKTYMGQPLFFSFLVDIESNCTCNKFAGKIKIHVNSQPVGDMLFVTKIEKGSNNDSSCVPFDVISFDTSKMQKHEKELALKTITKSLENLKLQLNSTINDSERSKIEKDIIINEKCIDLINSGHIKNSVKKVFISSTSDMLKYREVLKSLVQQCEMFPEMYENWGQGNIYPRDMCCEKVLHSDMFVLLLGAKYGFVEPEWNMSMTEIEYHTALLAGIPILVFLQESYKDDIAKLSGQDSNGDAQKHFIEDIKNSRLIRLFEDEDELELRAMKEILLNK